MSKIMKPLSVAVGVAFVGSLAIAQADFEKAYTAMFDYMNEHGDGPPRMLVFTPGVTMH